MEKKRSPTGRESRIREKDECYMENVVCSNNGPKHNLKVVKVGKSETRGLPAAAETKQENQPSWKRTPRMAGRRGPGTGQN